MADQVEYLVTLPASFGADGRRRAGITVLKSEGYRGPLTKEQLKALKDDPEFSVQRADDAEPSDPDTSVADDAAKKILDEAKTQAEKVLSEAQADAEKVATDAAKAAEAVTAKAQTEADQIVDAAKKQAEAIVADAKTEADKKPKQ